MTSITKHSGTHSAKHTPGPWALDAKTGSITWGDCSFGAPVGAGGFIVASHSISRIPSHQSERLTDEHHANARLIAEAPAMLEALATMLGAAEAEGLDDKSNVWRSVMIEASAILTRIDGE